jgi:hypothetical protein
MRRLSIRTRRSIGTVNRLLQNVAMVYVRCASSTDIDHHQQIESSAPSDAASATSKHIIAAKLLSSPAAMSLEARFASTRYSNGDCSHRLRNWTNQHDGSEHIS